MVWMMAAQLGLSALQGAASYKAKKQQAEAQEKWRKYNNAMVNLGNAMNQNAITQNEVLAMQNSVFQATELKKLNIQQTGAVAAAAAAAGVKGRSVNQSMFNVQRNAANADRDRQISLQNQFAAFDQQRLQSGMSAAMQQNHTQIQKPSLLNEMAGTISKAVGFGMSGGFSSIGSSLSGMFGGGGQTGNLLTGTSVTPKAASMGVGTGIAGANLLLG